MDCALVCLPFAGGGASFFRGWREHAPGGLTVVPIQLPGREERFVEEPYRDAIDAAGQLVEQVVTASAGHHRIALLGHSLGAVLAFEIARGLEQVELSWILEDNMPMRRVLEGVGAKVYKTYRVYEKAIA